MPVASFQGERDGISGFPTGLCRPRAQPKQRHAVTVAKRYSAVYGKFILRHGSVLSRICSADSAAHAAVNGQRHPSDEARFITGQK